MSGDFCGCDYDPADFQTQQDRKSRKHHRCSECRGTIYPAENYRHVTLGMEGTVMVFKVCSRCLDLHAWMLSHVPCFCWVYEELHERAIGCAQEYGKELPGLVFGTLRRIFAARGRSKRRQWLVQAALESPQLLAARP